LRFVFASFRNSLWLIELAILRDGPFSDDFERFPRLAASAAPAAICCFFDFAGIQKEFASQRRIGFVHAAAVLRQKK
jgi:hypothetical protein